MPPKNHTFRPIIWFFYSLVRAYVLTAETVNLIQ